MISALSILSGIVFVGAGVFASVRMVRTQKDYVIIGVTSTFYIVGLAMLIVGVWQYVLSSGAS